MTDRLLAKNLLDSKKWLVILWSHKRKFLSNGFARKCGFWRLRFAAIEIEKAFSKVSFYNFRVSLIF